MNRFVLLCSLLSGCTFFARPTCDACADGFTCSADGVCFDTCDTDDACQDGYHCSQSECIVGCAEDADSDGVCDRNDRCDGGDDTVDYDSDGMPDACDPCPLGTDALDSDGDGVCDEADLCPGVDDSIDSDGDGYGDECDACPLEVGASDPDQDTVCNDVCEGLDDRIDADANGLPDCSEHAETHWQFHLTDPVEWFGYRELRVSEDALGQPNSGAIRLDPSQYNSSSATSPCIQVVPGADYDLTLWTRIPQPIQHEMEFGLDAWENDTCSGERSTFGLWPSEGDTTWHEERFTITNASDQTGPLRSWRLRVVNGPGRADVYFDNVTLTPAAPQCPSPQAGQTGPRLPRPWHSAERGF